MICVTVDNENTLMIVEYFKEFVVLMEAKICVKCGVEKLLSDFCKKKANKGGLNYQCRSCSNEYNKQYRIDNHIARKEYTQKYKERHKENYRKQYESNPEKMRKLWRDQYKQNIESKRESARKYRKNNPEKRRVMAQIRRARIIGNGGSYTEVEWKELKEKYGNKCLRCKKKKKLTVDHIIPISKGGTSNINNLQPLCKSCNSIKKDKTIDFRE